MPFAFGCSCLFSKSGSFLDFGSLQLGEHGEYADDEFSMRRRSVEVLRHGSKAHIVLLKYILDQIHGVLLATGKSVQLIDKHHVDLSSFAILYHGLQAGTIHVSARLNGIGVDFVDHPIFRIAILFHSFDLFRNGIIVFLFVSGYPWV